MPLESSSITTVGEAPTQQLSSVYGSILTPSGTYNAPPAASVDHSSYTAMPMGGKKQAAPVEAGGHYDQMPMNPQVNEYHTGTLPLAGGVYKDI
jgi:hypothetical protein